MVPRSVRPCPYASGVSNLRLSFQAGDPCPLDTFLVCLFFVLFFFFVLFCFVVVFFFFFFFLLLLLLLLFLIFCIILGNFSKKK